jgi:AcrR family transcriptional regulator
VSLLSKRIAQGRATRDNLIAAAREEFGVRGYAETAIEDIVRRARVTKGAFYHHFSGKEDLFREVLENVKKELSRAAFVVHVDHKPFAPPEAQQRQFGRFVEQTNAEVWEQLVERCRRYVELHTDPQIRRLVLVDARSVLHWKDLQRIEEEHGITLLRADFRRAMRRGIIKRLPLRMLAVIFAGALNEVCLTVADAEDPAQALDESMTVIKELLDGLRVAPSP